MVRCETRLNQPRLVPAGPQPWGLPLVLALALEPVLAPWRPLALLVSSLRRSRKSQKSSRFGPTIARAQSDTQAEIRSEVFSGYRCGRFLLVRHTCGVRRDLGTDIVLRRFQKFWYRTKWFLTRVGWGEGAWGGSSGVSGVSQGSGDGTAQSPARVLLHSASFLISTYSSSLIDVSFFHTNI